LPDALPSAEHAPAHDARARALDLPPGQIAVGAGLTALEAVRLTPRRQPERPFVQELTALAEWMLQGRIRPGDEAVERRRDVEERSRHVFSPVGSDRKDSPEHAISSRLSTDGSRARGSTSRRAAGGTSRSRR